MKLAKRLPLVLGLMLLCVPIEAAAQDGKYDKPVDLKPLVVPVFPLPRDSQINPGAVGGNQTPYTTAPLQGSGAPSNPSQPGLRFSIPSRSNDN
jgi:hypothetical protein